MSGVDNGGTAKLDFQVIVRILEARNLIGLDIDPCIEVSIGDQQKITKTKKSTNSAVFDEDFTFQFSLPPVVFQQQIITIEAISDSRLSQLRRSSAIGCFKIDIATVKSQPDSCFIHKWALLLNSDDPLSGPKGYVKCDLIICTPGVIPKTPDATSKNDEDIEGNLLIPEDFSSKNIERQPARYFVTIFEAKDLPPKTSGVMASMKKAFVGDAPKELIDPFVQVSFAGKMGKTKVKKNCVNPKWNEEIIFYEMFPSLVKIIRIHVKDDSQSIIATTFLDFTLIADNSMNGFLPTFGPAWLNLYGNHRDINDDSPLNFGVGEGLAYRGSLKISLSVELLNEFPKKGLHSVEHRNVQQNQTNLNMVPLERFLLFCTIFETGKEGLNEDLLPQAKDDSTKKQRPISDMVAEKTLSKTASTVLVSTNKMFCSIPSCAKKPCMHLYMEMDDLRKRLYMINRLNHFSADLVNVIKEIKVKTMNNFDMTFIRNYFMTTLNRLMDNCKYMINLLESEYIPIDVATILDLEKQRQRKIELNIILKSLTDLKKKQLETTSTVNLISPLEKCLSKLQLLAIEPQDSLPDVYLWFIIEGKKVAYKRLKPEDLLYSTDGNEKGKFCSKVESFFLKTPVIKDKDDQPLRYHVKVYFWLGTETEKVFCINDLPPVFSKDDVFIPSSIEYIDANEFEMRCHVFQGRSLIGSDESGLSDPFVCVSFNGQCQQSQIVEQTLCPLWDECLLFPKFTLYSSLQYISNNVPYVTLQVYDFDKLGENEFLGQCDVACVVKLNSDSYGKPKFPPSLDCYSLIKNSMEVGEILAVCELIQVGNNVETYPELPTVEMNKNGAIMRIPSNIKPALSYYRLEVLFWGLRDLKTSSILPIDQPKIQIDWGNGILESESIVSYKKNPNFKTLLKTIQIKLPDNFNYQPPITIRCLDSQAFGRNVLIGTCTVNNIMQYTTPTIEEHDFGNSASNSVVSLMNATKGQPKSLKSMHKLTNSMPNLAKFSSSEGQLIPKDSTESLTFDNQLGGNLTASYSNRENLNKHEPQSTFRRNFDITVPTITATDSTVKESEKKETAKVVLDWWSKYYASVEELEEKNHKETTETTKKLKKEKNLNESSSSLYEKAMSASSKKMKHIGKQLTSKTDLTKITEHENANETLKKKPKKDLKNLNIATLQIYDRELESVPEFNGFKDCFEVFNLYRGKKLSGELDGSRLVGKFKGQMNFQRITNSNQSLLVPRHLNNEPVKVMVRVYVIKAINLRPCDPNGKADPYLNIILGKTKICDKANKITSQLNPVFGKLFETEANFPEESELVIQIYDWDRLTSDDLMGETKIDLEQRYYSKHRACCGLPLKYESTGYNAWRDSLKPTQILSKICKLYSLSDPTYTNVSVTVDDKIFTIPKPTSTDKIVVTDMENLALSCLHQLKDLPKIGYSFVPEHVEMRTLSLPEKPGMEQGKLELWIDMFPMVGHTLPLPTIISPRKASSCELRVIIWDTKEVILDDYNALTGASSVDQYIKCYLIAPDVDGQQTDVHYRSLNGDGNFNWRFIFKFDYMDAEEKIVHCIKESIFSLEENEEKLPPKLNLQVWDADVITADDFLGNLLLNLNKLPRGAKSAKKCSMDLLKPNERLKTKSYLNLFDVKRTRGWYPFVRQEKSGVTELAGKVDLELQLMSAEDAEKKPAGHGRDAPEPMPPPQ